MKDYYELDDLGCCLICEDGYEGCLCLKCKCTKCDWYSGNDDDLAHETTDFGGKWCTLVDVWRNEKQEEFERGKLASDYEINDTLRVTEKAIQCTLKHGKITSQTIFWIPKSILIGNSIPNWFIKSEKIPSKFKEDLEAQSKLF